MTGNHTSQARHIVDRLGGRSQTMTILGWPHTKVESVLRSGFIRCQDHAFVLQKAWEHGIHLNELDFVVHLRGLTAPQRTAA